MKRHSLLIGVLSVLVFVTFLALFSQVLPENLRGALFQRDPTVSPPTTGLFIFRGYEAQPNERGSLLVEAGENLSAFETLSFTFAVDSARAEVVRVRRTAVTQNFEISVNFSAPGVVHVALSGTPRQVNQGQSLVEIELQLRDNTINTVGSRLELRLIDTFYLVAGDQVHTTRHDGLLTIITNQNALNIPFAPFIADVEPAIYPLVQHRAVVIRGRALPTTPRVLLGSRPIPVISSSETEILAMIPEETAPGTYTLSVESLLADERVVVFDAVGPSGSVDLLDELLFFSPNPVLYNAQNQAPGVVLWVPVHNPLGSSDPVIGSVDLSRIGGNPHIIFSGVGVPALGPGGTMVNWFRIPETGTLQLRDDLEPNVDYPVHIRVENRTQTRDSAVELLQLRSRIPQGAAPFFGTIETVPADPTPGDQLMLFADITDQEGVDTVQRVSARLTPLLGGIQEMRPVLTIPRGDSPLSTMTFSTSYTLPKNIVPGIYTLEFTARDVNGNEATTTFPVTVSAPGAMPVGSPPEFSGRREARPTSVRPGGIVDFFVGVRDPDGTQNLSSISIDLIPIGGGIIAMKPALQSPIIGTLPVVYTATFTLPTTAASGTHDLNVRAVDVNGLEAQTSIPLTVDTSPTGGVLGNAPEFSGRLEASPSTVPLRGETSFFVSVRDLEGSDTIEQVTMDLVDIGGSIFPLQPAVPPVTGSTQPVVYTGKFTLPGSAVPGAYSLAVAAVDADGNLSRTTLPLTVSAVSQQGSIPAILQLFATPREVAADGQSDVSFTVEVEDSDGVEDIAFVRINLAPIDLSIEPLNRESVGSATKGLYTLERIRVAKTVRPALYDLQVEVEDKARNRVQRSLRLSVGGRSGGGGSPPELRDARFVPEVGRPGKNIDLFVEVKDLNGTKDVTVIADLTDLRDSVRELEPLITFPSGTIATQNTFAFQDLTLAEDLRVGVYDVPITVIDDTGNVVIGGARLRVERGGEDDGQPPSITVHRSFQSPRVLPNDGETKGEIHVLVHDADDDVLTAIVNLGSLGYAISASRRDGVGDIELLCSESRSVVCMQPGAPESPTDRWFILKEVVIPQTTLPSTEPYPLTVTAIDEHGNTDKETIPFHIGGRETAARLARPPEFLTIVSVDEDELELLVSTPISMESVDRGGGQFLLQPTLNASATARVTRVSWDTTGKLLYLQTSALTPGETYTLTVAAPREGDAKPLTDVHGNRFTRDQGGSIVFAGYSRAGAIPRIERVSMVDPKNLDVRFATQVIPSSVHPDLLPSRSSLQSTTSGEQFPIRDGELREQGRVLRLAVDPLREGDRYRLRIAGVLAPGLVEVPSPGAEATFIAVFQVEGEGGPFVLPTADLNRDGRVDFADFALFSAVYGTEYNLAEKGREAAPREEASLPPPPPRFGVPPPSGEPFGGELPPIELPKL